ncbi:MAG: sigma-70 family RNA polymerase sigma factor [Planctomycetota bacterium]|nr:sigma-70 family RNA polymerase sigma factor [Planctomycetota bacterium]
MSRADPERGVPAEASDDQLLGLVREGDERAFEVLFGRHEPQLARQIQRSVPATLRRKISVSDVIQETRIVALQRAADFKDRGPGSLRAWFGKIAENKVGDAMRRYAGTAKRGAAQEVSRDHRPHTNQFEARGPTPSEVAMGAELEERLRRILETLPEDYRTVLRLARFEGLSLREVADRIGRSREAVKKLYARALSKFTQRYQRMMEERNA